MLAISIVYVSFGSVEKDVVKQAFYARCESSTAICVRLSGVSA